MAIIGENNFRYFKKINRLFAGADYDYNLDQFLGIFNGQDGITYDVNFGNITANSLIASVIGDSSSTILGDGSQLTGISANVVNLSPTAFPPLSIFNALEKNGIDASNPNSLNIRNSFNTSTPMTASIRVPYLTTAGTSIFFDHGLTGELEEINNTQTTADWTAGTNTPIIDADSTNYLQGNKSIKMSKTVAGAIDIYDTVVLSLTDRNLRVSAFLNTLTNVSYLYVILYTSSGNTAEYRFPVATLTAADYNHLTVNLDNAPDAVAGTFVESTITRVYLGVFTSASQAIEVSWSTLTAISREPFLVPGYSQAVIVRDGTNQQHISVMSEDSNLKGKYVLSDALSNNYSSDTTMITSNSGTVSGNQMIHDSTATGEAALKAKLVNSLQLHGVLPRASLSSFARYYHPPLEITAFTSGTQIEAYSATNVSAYYTAGTTVIVYKRLRVNGKYQSMNGTATKNFFYATLANNSSYAGTTLSLELADAIDPGTDETGYYIVPESILFEYSAGSKTATTFTQAVPSELIVNPKQTRLLFNEQFTNSTLSGLWKQYLDYNSGSNNIGFDATYDWLYLTSYNSTGITGRWARNAENYNISKEYEFLQKFQFGGAYTDGPENQQCGGISCYSNVNNASVDINDFRPKGLCVVAGTVVSTGKNRIRFYANGVVVDTFTYDFNLGTYYLKTRFNTSKVYVKAWLSSTTEPETWTTVFNVPATFTSDGNYINIHLLNNSVSASGQQTYCHQTKVTEIGKGYTLKYNIPNLTNIEKLETITTIDRKNSAQEPVLYETGSQLY